MRTHSIADERIGDLPTIKTKDGKFRFAD